MAEPPQRRRLEGSRFSEWTRTRKSSTVQRHPQPPRSTHQLQASIATGRASPDGLDSSPHAALEAKIGPEAGPKAHAATQDPAVAASGATLSPHAARTAASSPLRPLADLRPPNVAALLLTIAPGVERH